MDAALERGFRLGQYLIHPLQGEIEGPGGTRHIQPKVVDVLLCLAAAGGRLVERETLIREVWGTTHVTDEVLTRCISELRHALDDNRGDPRFIQTVPKRGYRLIAPVVHEAAAGEPVPSSPPSTRSDRRRTALFVAGAVVFVAAAGWWLRRDDAPATPTPLARSSLAVIPTALADTGAADLALEHGFAEDLADTLASLEEVRVPPRELVEYRRGQGLADAALAERLTVKSTVKLSVRSVGDELQLTAIIVGEDGVEVWQETYQHRRDDADLLGVKQEIMKSVAERLLVKRSPASQAKLDARPTEANDAYVFYLQGVGYLRRPRQAETLDTAEHLFERALTIDDRFALAHGGLCETYLARFVLTRETAQFERAEKSCHRALTLDPDRPEVHVALGHLYRHSGQFERAEGEFRRAIALRPRLEEAHYGLGRSLQGQGRLAEAEDALIEATELEPDYWGPYQALGNFRHHYGRYEDAIEPYSRVVALTPDNPDGYTNLGSAYYNAGNWEQAEQQWRKSLELRPTRMGAMNMGTLLYYLERFDEASGMFSEAVRLAPEDHRAWGRLGSAQRYVQGREADSSASYRRAIEFAERELALTPNDGLLLAQLGAYRINVGDSEGARRSIERALASEPGNPDVHFFAAIVHLRLGDEQAALAALERSVELGYARRLIVADPQLESIRGSARFHSLIARSDQGVR